MMRPPGQAGSTGGAADPPAGTTYWCERAWLPPGRVAVGVAVEVAGDRIRAVHEAVPPDGPVLAGLVIPGLANAHSHVFHRALRGRTQSAGGSFWTWRTQMYDVANRLDPDSYLALARAAYAEMALAGITCVGEFHYLHHGPGGAPYAEPNELAHSLVRAAGEAGLRLALLDACYLTGEVGEPLGGVQRRFGDGDAHRWAERADALVVRYADRHDVVVGAAVHSVRAVPPPDVHTVAEWANRRAAPLHAHVSEQPAENDACLAAYGVTPTRLLAEAGALGPRTTAVHATHVDHDEVALLGGSGTHICLCPTTERDLADGIGPGRALAAAGSPVVLGSDSHAVVDLFEEMRAAEMHERLATGRRGHWPATELLAAGTQVGHAALGFADAGVIAPGAWADLVAVRLDSVRTAGCGDGAEAIVYAATAADVRDVVASGQRVVRDGLHVLGDVSALLRTAISSLTAG